MDPDPMDPDPLDAVARRQAGNPLFFAWTLASYQRAHNLDDAALCALLGCTPATLTDLRLCRRPGAADSKTADEDVARIAGAFNVNPDVLRQIAAADPQ